MKTLTVILLCVCTISFFNAYPKYEVLGAELLKNGAFNEGLNQWRVSESGVERMETGSGVRLSANDFRGSRSLSQIVDLPSPGLLLLLSCDIKTNNIVDGERSWETGRLVLHSLDEAGKPMYQRPHLLISKNSSHDWSHAEKAFDIGPDVSKIEVAAQLIHSTGELWVKSFSLRPVMLKEAFRQYRLLFLGAWLIVAVWVGWPFARSAFNSWSHGLVLLLSFGIFLGVLMPENIKESFGAAITASELQDEMGYSLPQSSIDKQFFGLTLAVPKLDVFKLGHFVMFSLLTFILLIGRPYRLPTVRLMFYLWLFASVSEVLQLFMPGRSSQLGDIFIDCCGIATGFVFSISCRCNFMRPHSFK